MSDDLPFCPVPYVDPVQRLASLIGEAAEKGSWLPGKPSVELRMEVRESIQRAIVGTERIGHSLRYGMGKQAGEFETELRRVLGELKSASYSMPPFTPYYADYFSRFREDVEITARMSAELLTTASEPYGPKQWSSRLGALRGALDVVHRGMAQFFKAAELASDSLEQTHYHVETALIPSLEERLAEVMPSIAFALEDADCSDLEVEALCWRLRRRADIIFYWGVERRDEAGSCDKPSDQFGDCCQRVHSLIGCLTPLPSDDEAKTPGEKKATTSDGAGGEEEKPEWSAPMTRTEMARRITGNETPRLRKVQPLLDRFGLDHVEGRNYRVRLDRMDANTRRKIESRQ